ncbi:MAG: sugar-binding domain-containing protein [Verrucomicrobiota bacterium]
MAIATADHLDLTGEWRFALDPQDQRIHAGAETWKLPEVIRLPGIVTAQGFGEIPSFQTQWTGDGWRYPELFKEWQAAGNFKFPFFLQPPRHYVGPAWYQREIDIPANWQGSHAVLLLERVHWHSTVWLDGKERGTGDSLGTPHEFDLGLLAPGRHDLTLRIDNRLGEVNVGPLSHSVTDHTQGNWNGVVGKIELRKRAAAHLDNLQVFAAADGTVRLVVTGTADAGQPEVSVHAELRLPNEPDSRVVVESGVIQRKIDGSFEVEMTAKLKGPPRPWNEFSPTLYQASVSLTTGAGGALDQRGTTFGIREPGSKGGRITLNGHEIFLRGTLECCIFPLTGHPPTDVESWRRIVRICKAHGLNHIRFHSWCPPEAAFAAADELGFYYQVEVSSWANQGAEIGSGRPLDAWLEAESGRMLAAYGNHPSLLMMAYGNEPAGANHKRWLQQWVARRKLADPRRLYTTGSGWPIMAGSGFHSSPDPRLQGWGQGLKSILNGEPPRTDFDWRGFVGKHPDAPVISHEIGQWCVYPNFGEIGKYTGYFKARNFEIFQETARRAGLLGQAKDFVMASGKLQALAYKHDIEAALRTPGFGGFQLLDLHDFPGQGTALVGVLDAFWEEKGYISPAQFRRFCGPVVPLARLKQMVFTTAETLVAELELAQFGPRDLAQVALTWEINAADGSRVAGGALPPRDLRAGALHPLGAIRVPLGQVKAPAKLTLTVGARGQDFANSWEVFVYQADGVAEEVPGVMVTRDLEVAKGALARGGNVLWLPAAARVRNDDARPLVAGFSPIFWNTAWTAWQPPHTLGILCDPKHPALAGFPTDFHSNWQWWELQQNAQPFILTELRDLKPLVQVIDDWVTNRKLGYVFEARVGTGRLVACSADLAAGLSGRPAARQLRASLLHYMAGQAFAPTVDLTPAQLADLLK